MIEMSEDSANYTGQRANVSSWALTLFAKEKGKILAVRNKLTKEAKLIFIIDR